MDWTALESLKIDGGHPLNSINQCRPKMAGSGAWTKLMGGMMGFIDKPKDKGQTDQDNLGGGEVDMPAVAFVDGSISMDGVGQSGPAHRNSVRLFMTFNPKPHKFPHNETQDEASRQRREQREKLRQGTDPRHQGRFHFLADTVSHINPQTRNQERQRNQPKVDDFGFLADAAMVGLDINHWGLSANGDVKS